MKKILPTQPFVYGLIWPKHDKKYIGVRYAEGCGLDDLATVYFSSSREVKNFRKIHGDPEIVKIIKSFKLCETFEDWIREGTKAFEHEQYLLKLNDAANDFSYLNVSNGSGKPLFRHRQETRAKMSAAKAGENHPLFGKSHSEETRAKMSAANAGEKNPAKRPEVRAKISAAMTGKNAGEKNPAKRPEVRAKMSAAKKGKNHSDETRAKMSAAKAGKLHWNNGIICKRSAIQPGPDFVRGRIQKANSPNH